MAITLKKKTLSIIIILFFVLSLGATAYILWTVESDEDLTPDEGEAGLGLRVGQYGCVTDTDCLQEDDGYVECDEVMSHNPASQRCEYYRCKTGYTISSDRLECIPDQEEEDLSCGDYGCTQDSDCTDEDNECAERSDNDATRQRCVLIEDSCPDGYTRTEDKCDCEEIEEDPVCGDGKLNVTGEECEDGNPSGADCTWSQCNQDTCKCPTCGDGELNVSGEECEEGNPSGVDCSWSDCYQTTCVCPKCGDGKINLSGEECEEGDPSGVSCGWDECTQSTCKCIDEVVPDDDDELPDTGIEDISDEIMVFYITFFIAGGILVMSYVLESPQRKYENEVVDRFDD